MIDFRNTIKIYANVTERTQNTDSQSKSKNKASTDCKPQIKDQHDFSRKFRIKNPDHLQFRTIPGYWRLRHTNVVIPSRK